MGSASVQQKAVPHQQNLSSDEKIKIISQKTNWPQEKDHFFCKLGKSPFEFETGTTKLSRTIFTDSFFSLQTKVNRYNLGMARAQHL